MHLPHGCCESKTHKELRKEEHCVFPSILSRIFLVLDKAVASGSLRALSVLVCSQEEHSFPLLPQILWAVTVNTFITVSLSTSDLHNNTVRKVQARIIIFIL